MTTTAVTSLPALTAALAREQVNERLRAADTSRLAAQLPARNSHRTLNLPTRWLGLSARAATPRSA